jgi:hypothetical protein
MRAHARAPSESVSLASEPAQGLAHCAFSFRSAAMAAAPARPFRVALAVDASPAARHAATWAAASGLLGGPGTELHLVSVVPTPPLPAPPGRPTLSPGPLMPPSMGSVAAQGMEEYMRRVDEQNQTHRSLLQETAQRLVQQARRDGRAACLAMRAVCLLRADMRAVAPQVPTLHSTRCAQAVLEGDGAGGSAIGAPLVEYCRAQARHTAAAVALACKRPHRRMRTRRLRGTRIAGH